MEPDGNIFRDDEISGGVLETLREAIRHKRRVFCWHAPGLMAFCPHVLGRRADGHYVLAYLIVWDKLYAKGTRVSARRWRWLKLSEIRSPHAARGEWWTAPRATRPPLQGLSVELEVEALDPVPGAASPS